MDNLVSLYTSTTGRIGRQQWWIGTVILIVINLVITFFILPPMGFGMPNAAAMADPAALVSGMSRSAWASLVLLIIFAYPLYALGVKRRHDKDKSGIDYLIYLALLAILLLVQATGMGYTSAEMSGLIVPVPTLVYSIVAIVVGIYGIYMLVVLGFLRGTTGATNQYGPDPLGGA